MQSISPVFSSATDKNTKYSPPWADLSIIGIAGSSGSGKTSVAMEIVKSLNLPWVVILVMDSFYKSLTPEEHARAHANDYDFDCPESLDFDVLVQTLRDLKQGKKADIPVYSFAKHQREPQTTTLYSPHVVMRDVRERGRDIEGIIKQWFTYVKPSYKKYVEPQRAVSDMVVKHIQRNLDEKSEKHSAELTRLGLIASEETLSPNVVVMQETPQFIGMNTILQDPATEHVDFVFYFDRLAALLIEKALDVTSYIPKQVNTPQETSYHGLNQAGTVSAVAILRGGSCLETALKRTIPDCITGRVLIQTNEKNEEPELHYLKLPPGIEEHENVMLLDPQMSSGGAALMAVRVLIDHGVREERIVFVTSDPRFANIQNDPRYRLPSKRHTHVKLDKRFAHMLRDKDFSRNAAVDRYGRKLARDDTKKQLERFYRLEEENGDEDEEGEEVEGSVADDEEVLAELRKADAYDPARDGGFGSSSSEDESESESDEEDESGDSEGEGEDDDDAQLGGEELEFPDKQQRDVPTGEVTDRIAVVNLDWDNIRAEDLMAVFSSFVPAGGRVLKVSVYPSEFGKERMEREETEGPPKEIFASADKGSDDDDEEEGFEGFEDEDEEEFDSDEEEEKIKKSMLKEDKGEEFNSTKLRKYQLERLRYFYAILTFSSREVAKHVYDLVDGAEYLSSANFFDLRFVPDDTDFSDDRPRDECKRIPDGYQPNEFVTDALQHSKVKLTWDMEDKSRKEAQARAFRGSRKDIDENDLKAYLASDSSDDEEEGGVEVMDATQGEGTSKHISKKEEERQRMRALLGLGAEPTKSSKSDGPVGEMEVTFTSGLAGGPNRDSVFENEPQIEETTIERYIRKERERKKRRKEKLKGNKHDDDPDASEAEKDDAKPTAEEQPQQEDLGFDDPFFDDPDGKATAAARRKEEKRKRREERAAEEAAAAAKRAELELLMVDENNKGMKHFDMNEIEKAEKQARKKGKKGKGKGKQAEPLVDDFKMEVADPRFSRLFESHEFAIDPTNPKFKATSGMKALLEEGRKRRRDRDDHAEDAPSNQDRAKKQKKQASKDAGSDDLKKLVDKVKRKTQPR
ncbi:pre-rRNA-processing protein ESF1 [Aspergillus homomorphus CBS 101889]|uniref:uridine/cytidine kinase n=1 Tax=Aspergillus homomorphus (strain CBS 101889) TaxID=1450537 RepID=A0A395I0N5_ASPHC|nr:PRK-domain-containing protein [Aspergillus homomorphus CBS 101889]RAL13751.1 PRK-domain-containing protein [Aspergillus homomorphus CBS 101889]